MNDHLCKCGHLESWHRPNDLNEIDPEKFCRVANGICAVRSCPCCKFSVKTPEVAE